MNAIFNADALLQATTALQVEGEFDALLATQAFGMPGITFGSATNTPDFLLWSPYFFNLNTLYTAYDGDSAGEKGDEKSAAFFQQKNVRLSLPEAFKDIAKKQRAALLFDRRGILTRRRHFQKTDTRF